MMYFSKHLFKRLLLCSAISIASTEIYASDSDMDGVLDIYDMCPDTAAGASVFDTNTLTIDLSINWEEPNVYGSITDPNWSGLGNSSDEWQVTLSWGSAETTEEADDSFEMSVVSSTIFTPGTSPADGHTGTFEDNYLFKYSAPQATMARNMLRGKVDYYPGWNWTLMRSINNILPGDVPLSDFVEVLTTVNTELEVTELFSKSKIAEHSKAGTGLITSSDFKGAGCAVPQSDLFKITSVYSGKVVDVSNISVENGASIHQWDYVGGQNQKWYLDATGVADTYQIRSAHSDKCIDVDGPSTWNGANVHQWDCHNGDSQRWTLQENSVGDYQIVNVFSGKCLDVQEWNPNNGGNLQQWSCGGNTNQLWLVEGI